MRPVLLWFRRDLRLRDNGALRAAVARGGAIVPVFVLDDEEEGRWRPGGASRWWLHHALAALDGALRERGSRLILARGDSAEELRRIGREVEAGALFWNRRHEPGIVARDARIEAEFAGAGSEIRHFGGALLHEPSEVANREGAPFRVFTPFWRRCLELAVEEPLAAPSGKLNPPTAWPVSVSLEELELAPRGGWAAGLAEVWRPGEEEARRRLKNFATKGMAAYAERRDLVGEEGTSRLSPHLHFGEISPRQVWAAARARSRETGVFPADNGTRVFLAELGWREFAHHLLAHFPETPERAAREAFERFPWAADPGGKKLQAWQRGRTGYPIVDAAMRQLWRTGWMHNRARMIAASFLVKHLRLPWRLGAEWFHDTLVDADLANNTLGWQWVAGCGMDAAPYFRIFSPVRQGEKFDAEGVYTRRWVPELARLPAEHLHAPWEAPTETLAAAGVTLGETYPRPLVDPAQARAEALEVWREFSARERRAGR